MLRRARSFIGDRKGLAAVEFGLIAPVMVIMFFGGIEVASAVDCNARVSRVASTVSDLVSQSSAVSTADATNIFNAANAILYPFAAANAKIVVSSIVSSSTGTVSVAWSEAQNTAKRASPPANIPTGILPNGASVIYAEVTYTFTPAIAYVIGTMDLTSTFYSKPRRSAKVTHS